MNTFIKLIASASLFLVAIATNASQEVLLPGPTSSLTDWPSDYAVRGEASVSNEGIVLSLAEGSSPWRAVIRSPEPSFGLDSGVLEIQVDGITFGGIPGEKGSNSLFVLIGSNANAVSTHDYYPLALPEGVSFNILRKRDGYYFFVYPGRDDKVGEQLFPITAVPTGFTLTLDEAKGTWTMTLQNSTFIDQDSSTATAELPRSVYALQNDKTYLALGVLNWGQTDEGSSATIKNIKVVREKAD